MYCTKCGCQLEKTDQFCERCGAEQKVTPSAPSCNAPPAPHNILAEAESEPKKTKAPSTTKTIVLIIAAVLVIGGGITTAILLFRSSNTEGKSTTSASPEEFKSSRAGKDDETATTQSSAASSSTAPSSTASASENAPKPEYPRTAVVTTESGLNIRQTPDVESKKVGSMKKGTEFIVTGPAQGGGHWWPITKGAEHGYVNDGTDYDATWFEWKSAPPSQTNRKNLIAAMPADEYRKLNHFFDPFTTFTRLKSIKTDLDVVGFGVWQYHKGTGDFSIPKANVETAVKRYFGVTKINHEAVGDNGMETPSYRNGFYNSGGGVGWVQSNWCNVSEMTDNGDGTFTVKVSLYDYMGWYEDRDGTSRDIAPPTNRYDRISEWKLQSGQKIVDGGSVEDINIHRSATDVVILKPFIDNGEKTWQILGINGWMIPKILCSNE